MSDETMVEVYDETLVPDELCTVTVTMPADIWKRMSISLAAFTDIDEDVFTRMIASVRSAPSLSLISDRLSEACPKCNRSGAVADHEGSALDCPECGGSGKASVPGARLKPVGQHVEVK